MPLSIVIGAQWGDEGKGRIVDLLSAHADLVARYNGGDNAGHTVTVGENTFKLHLIPSGVIHPQAIGILGNGMVINPATLLQEMEMLAGYGIHLPPERLMISHAAHLITPAHRAIDRAQEHARGQGQIGTTGRGIGPAYTDKATRRGIRIGEILNLEKFSERLTTQIEEANHTLKVLYGAEALETRVVVQEYMECARRLAPYIGDVSGFVSHALKDNQFVLAEGAQGTLLDLDHGTYPFVTSSSSTAPGALVGLGLGICPVERVIGVTKTFQTRVGAGPFPTEVFDADAARLRGTGTNPWDEFGTTTGRPRRVGWLDGVLLRYSAQVNGLTDLVLTKLDILSGIENIKICTAYRSAQGVYTHLPYGPADLSPFEPVYEEVPGWAEDLNGVRSWEGLPNAAKAFIRKVSAVCEVPVSQVSVGPERDQVVDIPK